MRRLTSRYLAQNPLPKPRGSVDKNERGRVLAVASSHSVPGAALLVAEAALRAGAGKVQIAAPERVAIGLGLAMPEAGIISLGTTKSGDPPSRVSAALKQAVSAADVVIIGPGHKNERSSTILAVHLFSLETDATFIIDAVAIGGLWQHRRRLRACKVPLIITPHFGELARMMQVEQKEIDEWPTRYALEAARELNAIVALKSARTYVATPSGVPWRHEAHVTGLATSGSGDVLAGLIAGFAARGASALQAVLWGVLLHAKAGRDLCRRVGSQGFLARELLPRVPANF